MLKTKIAFILVFLVACISVYFYYKFDRSYILSTEAKKYYKLGEYKEAYELAKKAYDENQYNRMAFTLVVHSKKSLEWQKYIEETRGYLNIIEEISHHGSLSKSDKNRIKMICEISIENYLKLNKDSMLINSSLAEEAKELYGEIVIVNNTLFGEK